LCLVLPGLKIWASHGSIGRGTSRVEIVERMYTTKQVAEWWSVNPETIRRLAARGLLRSVRVGSERRYPKSALREYLQREGTAA
jgi:excisionase family DNA binding protein